MVAAALASLAAAPAASSKGKAKPKATGSATPTPTPPALDCESVKTRLAAAPVACSEESHEAASIACSASGHARLLTLDLSCMSKLAPRDAKKSPLAAPVDAGACRAVSVKDGSILADANVPDYQACMRQVQAAVVEKKCTGETREVEYLFLRGSHEPYVFTVRCP